MYRNRWRRVSRAGPWAAVLVLLAGAGSQGAATDLADIIERIKPGVVAVGSYQKTRRPASMLRGTGFVVADGRHVVTNAHVLPTRLDERHREFLAVFVGRGRQVNVRSAQKIAEDIEHDVAVLRIAGDRLPALTLGDDGQVREGQAVAFTGFPIGAALGLFAATHRGIVSAITPIAIPLISPRQLDARTIRRLRQNFTVFQLDATAYPGNSGSPLFDTRSGRVIGIVNMVHVKESKEKLLKEPSGIAYAIPVRHAKALLKQSGLLR